MDKLESARAKLGWAGEKFTAIDAKLRAYLALNNYEVVREHDPALGMDVLRMKLAGKPPLPREFSHLIAEFATALRASLDHFVWAMAVAPKRETAVQFPITDAQSKFPKEMDGVSNAICAAIERLQPYHAAEPHQHPLWRIRRLSNADKHRHIAVVPHAFVCTVSLPGLPRIGLLATFRDNLDGDPKVPIPPIAEGMPPQMRFEVQPAFAVVLQNAGSDSGILMPLAELPSLHHYVRDNVFPALEGFVLK